jgi:nucleotide-binding universal stress UspA family protein
VWLAPYAEQDVGSANPPNAGSDLFERARNECARELREFIVSAGLDPAAANVSWSFHSGAPAREILAHCQSQRCNWIVMGTHRRRNLGHWLLGSVAEEVMRHAACPVLVVPAERDSYETQTSS